VKETALILLTLLLANGCKKDEGPTQAPSSSVSTPTSVTATFTYDHIPINGQYEVLTFSDFADLFWDKGSVSIRIHSKAIITVASGTLVSSQYTTTYKILNAQQRWQYVYDKTVKGECTLTKDTTIAI
jgi:hypothetical protein